jgi:hypothetical protein
LKNGGEREMSGQDTNAIISIINLYGFAVDTQCWDLFDRVFTEDVDVDFSASARWQDRASFKRDFAVFHDPFDSTQHAMLNHLVHIEGDKAWAFTYGNWAADPQSCGWRSALGRHGLV